MSSTPPRKPPSSAASPKAAIWRQSLSISAAIIPFGVAFGVATRQGGMSVLDAMGFAALVFTGSAQFAAVTVLADGGTVAAAVISGLLLNLRSLAFGLVMAPALRGPLWWRAAVSQLMIDESTAVGSAQSERRWQRYGYLVCGATLFVFWNASILAGASVLGGADELITTLGIDATIPAAFLALLWPRLQDPTQRTVAALGAVVALLVAPIAAPGVPIVLAAAAVVVVRPWRASPHQTEAGVEP